MIAKKDMDFFIWIFPYINGYGFFSFRADPSVLPCISAHLSLQLCVHQTTDMYMIGKKSIELVGIQDFEWWVEGEGGVCAGRRGVIDRRGGDDRREGAFGKRGLLKIAGGGLVKPSCPVPP